MAECEELEDIYTNQLPFDYQYPYSLSEELIDFYEDTDAADKLDYYQEDSSVLWQHQLNEAKNFNSSSFQDDGSSQNFLHDTSRSGHLQSKVRMLSAAFRSESRAKIKDALIRGKDYLIMKVQDYQHKIRSNMNTKQETIHQNCSLSEQYQSQQELSEIMNRTMLPAEKYDSNSKSMQDNTEWSSENISKTAGQTAPQPSELYESKIKDTAPPCKKVPHNTPHDVPHGVDDLPLGVEANTLNEIPPCKLNEMPPSKLNETPVNTLNKMALSSTSDESESKPLEDSTDVSGEKPSSDDANQIVINPQDKTQQWLHTLTGRQQSFGSDLSAGTNSSSIELLLQGREVDPEEILRSLGFGSSQTAGVRARIPPRFFSDSKFCIDDISQRSELQELVDSWKSEKNSSDQLMQHSQIGPYLHHLRHLPSVQSPPCRSSIRSSLSMPQSILIPDNQLALASQGFYEYTPSIDSFLKEQSKQLPLPAAERRKNYRSTRTQQTWSLIEPEKDTESEMLKLKQNRNTFGASIDSALSSDMENSSEKRHFLTNSRWSFWKQPSKDSESSTSSIRDIRAGHVNKLMSFDETDDDYEVFSPLENHVRTLLSDRNSPLQIPEPRICDNFKRTSLERDLQTLISSTESTFDFSNDPNRYSLDNISDLTKYSKSTEHSQLQLSAAPMEVLSDNGLIPISAKEANFSDYPANMKEVRRLKIGAEKNPFIYRIGSAQSDSSGFVESDSLVEPPMSYLDALSVNDVGDRGGYDSSETISSGIYKRLSINSDTTIKDLAASSSSSSSQCPCDKSVGTDQIFKSDRSVSTEPFIKQTMASQTDSCCFCTWCINSNQVCAHLHSTVPYQSTVSTACGMSLHIDASNNFSPITDWTLETSPCLTRRRETSNLNLFISDGRILFCDNDSNNNQNWDSDDVESSRRLGCSFMELESTETNDLKSRTFSRHQNCLNRVSESDSPFCLLNSRSVSRIDDTSKNVIEYRKLLKLTNRKTFIQSFLNNPFLPYTPHVRIEIWAEKPINMHLQEENQLMQHAVQRYKFDLQIIESTFLSCFNHITDLLSEEETLMMDELYELWTAVNIEVGHLEKLLVERQRFVRNGNSELTTLTSLQVIPLMTKVLKEQLCAFHLNSDIFEMTMEPRNSNPIPFYPQPGWNSLSVEMQNLRSQISGQNNIQAVHLNRSMEELKESMLLEIQRNITQNFNRLFMG